MERWASVAEMVRELHLTSPLHDIDALKDELKAIRVECHPDKDKQGPADEERSHRYRLANEAAEFLDSRQNSQSMISTRDVANVMIAIKDLIQAQSEDRAASGRTEFREVARSEAHARVQGLRIGSSVFGAICLGLLAFPQKLEELGVPLGEFGRRALPAVSALGVLISAFLFVLTWIVEQWELQQAEWLATDNGMKRTLYELDNKIYPTSNSAAEFRFSQYRQILSEGVIPPRIGLEAMLSGSASSRLALHLIRFVDRLPPRNSGERFRKAQARMSLSAAEKIARVHLDELERRGMIQKKPGRTFDAVYSIELELLNETIRN